MSKGVPSDNLNIDVSNQHMIMLQQLRNEDDQIAAILCHISHTTLYLYNPKVKAWDRYGVEGPLVVVRRQTEPLHELIILNQNSVDKYIIDFKNILRAKPQDKYLMLQLIQDDKKIVLGCWIEKHEERQSAGDIMEHIIHITSAKPASTFTNTSATSQSISTAASAAAVSPTGRQVTSSAPTKHKHVRDILKRDDTNKTSHVTSPVNTSANDIITQQQHQLLTPSQLLNRPSRFSQSTSSMTSSSLQLSKAALRRSLLELANDDTFLNTLASKLAAANNK